MTEKKLPLTTEINGYAFTQIKRDGFRAIYAQEISPSRMHYEAFRIRVTHPKREMVALYAKKGKSTNHLPDRAEGFASDSAFGVNAFSCFTLEDAQKRYDALLPRSGDTASTKGMKVPSMVSKKD